MLDWPNDQKLSPTSMNLSTVNNSKSQHGGSSRSYILESESRITNGKGVLINKLGMVIVFKDIFSKAGFVLILGKHTVYTDGGTWYPQVCTFLNLKHRLHSHLEKSLIERVVQYFKDRILKIELNLLMTITHAIVKEEIVIMIMCITG